MVDDRDDQGNYSHPKSTLVAGDASSPRISRRAIEFASSPKQIRRSHGGGDDVSPKSHRKSNGRSYSLASPVKVPVNIDHSHTTRGKSGRGKHHDQTPPRVIPAPPSNDHVGLRRHSTHPSPVNSSGVEIVIDSGSEPEVDANKKQSPDSEVSIENEADEEHEIPTFGLYPEDSVDQEPEDDDNNVRETTVQIEGVNASKQPEPDIEEQDEPEVEDTESDAFLCAADVLSGDMIDEQPVSNSSQVYLLSEMS